MSNGLCPGHKARRASAKSPDGARALAQAGYARPNQGRDYPYLRASAKDPFDWLYFTPTVVRETYALLTFDAEGRVDWAATPSFHPHRDSALLASESGSLPSPSEREGILALLFSAIVKEEGSNKPEGRSRLGRL